MDYSSKLPNWYTEATVRSESRRVLHEEDSCGKIYFPPELVPVVTHPLVQQLGPAVTRDVLVQRLYLYLDFTSKLEHEVVNSVAKRIAHEEVGFVLPHDMAFDAYKLYTDEAYHALFSEDLKRQVASVTGIAPATSGTPRFLSRLRELQGEVSPELRQMSEVFFAIVSETLISSTLAGIPKDSRVVTTVREVIADHAEDEGRHHAYFSSVLKTLWPMLSPQQQAVIGSLLPEFILGFLEPDYDAEKALMNRLGLKKADSDLVIHESYPRASVLARARDAARVTLRLFEHNGILEEPGTREAFYASGLLG